MGIKSTRNISKEEAIDILLTNIPTLSNEDLATMLTQLGDCTSNQDPRTSRFDNFNIL